MLPSYVETEMNKTKCDVMLMAGYDQVTHTFLILILLFSNRCWRIWEEYHCEADEVSLFKLCS